MRPIVLSAVCLALGGVASSHAAGMDDEAIYKVLQFHGLGAKGIDAKTESVEGGTALPEDARVSDAELLASDALRKAIGDYYESKAVARRSWSVVKSVISEIEEIEIIARAGSRVEFRIYYLWELAGWSANVGHDRAEVLVEIIPNFTNEIYYRERYGKALAVEDSYFADVAREIADLKLAPGNDDRECVHNYHSPNPCVESIPLFERFAARHGFGMSVDAAYMFQAFVRGEYGRADRLYARAKGYTLPTYEGIGSEVAALGLRDHMAGGRRFPNCDYNYYSPNPCPGVIPLWTAFAERHGIALSRTSADMFEAYVEGAYRRGDRLYRAAKGIAEADYTGPGVAVMALGLDPSFDLDRVCQHDPTSPNRCVTSIVALEQFAAEHGLPLDRNTAEVFQAYVRHQVRKGDEMFARAKGIPIEAVGDPDYQPFEPPELIIDIVPGGASPAP